MTELAQGGIDITLPDNTDLRKELQALLDQTKEGLKAQREKHRYTAPELFTYHNAKIQLLEELLEKGQVNTWNFSRGFAKKWGGVADPRGFDQACEEVLQLIGPDNYKKRT